MKRNAKNNEQEIYTLSEVKDKVLGEVGTVSRDAYEKELEIELLGYTIKKIREQQKLTQTQLGERIGVKKAQISKLENNTSNVTINTLVKVFRALGKNLKIQLYN